jgi:hypothetical protein
VSFGRLLHSRLYPHAKHALQMHCTVHAKTLLLLAPQLMPFACDVPITSTVAYIPSAANTSFDFNVPAFVVCL